MAGGASKVFEQTIGDFNRQGFVMLRSLIPREDAQHLGELVEQRHQDPETHKGVDSDFLRSNVSLMRMFEYHQAFRDLLVLEPVISLVEQILGSDCHVVAQNALRTPTGAGIVNWHIDDALFFPFLANAAVLDVVGALPCYSLNVMVVLSDVDAETYGPTQVVVGSHLTGQAPEYSPALPSGVSPTSLLTRAGDAYLVNSQTWHRGAQNESGRTRYLLTTTYGRRFISQRFYPFLNYEMPGHVIAGASDRLLRVLGKHQKGPYG
jgi:ectoine hydroxylase-related dioxygenase (phytanoyl-CoA dioxygenase family)